MPCALRLHVSAQAAFRCSPALQLTRCRRLAAPPSRPLCAAQEALYEKRVELADRERVEQVRTPRIAAISRPSGAEQRSQRHSACDARLSLRRA